jgi:hypothetical protein
MIAAANVAQRGCRCGSRFLSGVASATYFFKVALHHRSPGLIVMQPKRRVVDEAVQIRCCECDLNIAHCRDHPINHRLWGFWSPVSDKAFALSYE